MHRFVVVQKTNTMFKFLLIFGLIIFIFFRIVPFLKKILGVYSNTQQQRHNQNQNNYSNQNDPKRFTKDVGEYVPYEEVKDDEKNKG